MTQESLSFSNRYLRIALMALVLLFLLLMAIAPAAGQRTSGSTFNRAPEGYLGWYRYMEDRGTPIQRWKRPLEDLPTTEGDAPQTLLRVYPGLVGVNRTWSRQWLEDWLQAGNTLIVLGVEVRVTEAPFTTRQTSAVGEVVVKTRRRYTVNANDRNLLGDEYGAIVWRDDFSENIPGALYFAATPHLAANAYQDAPGNYEFLADLVSQAGGTLWVDEYLHGYRDVEVAVEETVTSWGTYLSRTPITVIVIQVVIMLGLFLLAQNRRLGNLTSIESPPVDNSRAYIDALAAVLHKAESTRFLVDMITKAERSALLRSLGFHDAQVDNDMLKAAWTQQTGQPSHRLTPLLAPPRCPSSKPEQTLRQWLSKLRQIRQTPMR